ncbi:helix-turn-helix transcriptional regulator [Cytophagales bacterium LB-30]|uniref:Helix-turn-helix transcriptional regulator n=1 Tax=Shiella aurantiaca TaxID=3058365 RepID=A0ABT8F1X3_9BACT|nr:helix-turn-helix transcriptional regulator [Shiella aurantiaca]MDN4164446.1 helix-turn-helix transcriptional regulator [Shiella aurantiaca]
MNTSTELLKGTLSTIILRLLEGNGKMYGYELTQRVKELTGGKILIKEGSLYPALHKLEADGHIAAESVFIGKRIRKYYILTAQGSKVARQSVHELLDFLSTMEHLITTDPRYGMA